MAGTQNERSSANADMEADEALQALTKIFSDPKLAAKAQFRCRVDGPGEIDILVAEAIEGSGNGARSEYKRWVVRLYRRGLIPRIPDDWDVPETAND